MGEEFKLTHYPTSYAMANQQIQMPKSEFLFAFSFHFVSLLCGWPWANPKKRPGHGYCR